MKIELLRYNHDKESTQGIMSINGKFSCYTLEDQRQNEKVKGETRIPSGTYKIKFREVLSELTQKYRDNYGEWFTYHLELQNVPNFQYVYIHIGNSDKDTNGCILVADRAWNDPKDYNSYQSSSRPAFKRVYWKIGKAINDCEDVEITIKDIWQ